MLKCKFINFNVLTFHSICTWAFHKNIGDVALMYNWDSFFWRCEGHEGTVVTGSHIKSVVSIPRICHLKVWAAEMVESNVCKHHQWNFLVTELVLNLSSHQELNVIPEALSPQCNCSLRIEGGLTSSQHLILTSKWINNDWWTNICVAWTGKQICGTSYLSKVRRNCNKFSSLHHLSLLWCHSTIHIHHIQRKIGR